VFVFACSIELSSKENEKLFGPCNNVNGHGHNYKGLQVYSVCFLVRWTMIESVEFIPSCIWIYLSQICMAFVAILTALHCKRSCARETVSVRGMPVSEGMWSSQLVVHHPLERLHEGLGLSIPLLKGWAERWGRGSLLLLDTSVQQDRPSLYLRFNGHFFRWTWVSQCLLKQRMMEVLVTTGLLEL